MTQLNAEDKKAKEFLEGYLTNIAPTGYEMSGQRIWYDYVSDYMGPKDDFITDPYGSVAIIIKGSKSDYKVALDAHADEISWRVQYIESNGQIGVMRNGGSDSHVAPGSFVNIQGRNGQIKGVVGAPAIHVRGGDTDTIPDHDLRVDVAAKDKAEVLEMGIDVGMTITYASTFEWLNNETHIAGRALDDRVSGYALAQIVRKLKEENITLPYDLYIVNSVQEETGLRGAALMSNTIRPDVAIAVDVGHDTDTKGYNKSKQGDISCGKGPILAYGATLHNKVVDFIEETAKKKEIAIQKVSTGYSSGTNTDSYAYQGKGCASGLVKLPLKYMHTAVEMVSMKDVSDVTTLLFETLKGIEGNQSQFDYYAQDRGNWTKKLKDKGLRQ